MNRRQKGLYMVVLLLFLVPGACREASVEINAIAPGGLSLNNIRGLDLSTFPEMEAYAPVLRDALGNPIDFLSFIEQKGVNCIRLRLWVHPTQGHSGFEEVRSFAERLKRQGFQIWLALHYSDTWADPGQQEIPQAWKGLSLEQLEDAVYEYSHRVVGEIKPEIIQLGNEINGGFLFPQGNSQNRPQAFLRLLEKAIQGSRDGAPNSRVMLHYAGLDGISDFVEKVNGLDYDILGLSFYPLWHGRNLNRFARNLDDLAQMSQKELLIAETAYPFTLEWNDWTHNVLGQEDQLILPEFPASPSGQKDFMLQIRNITAQNPRARGFCYWGGEWIAFKGNQAPDGSPWENQALFDFNQRALPVWEVFEER